MKDNAHVVLYRELRLRRAAHYHLHFEQLCCYTELMLELDPLWKPDHMR